MKHTILILTILALCACGSGSGRKKQGRTDVATGITTKAATLRAYELYNRALEYTLQLQDAEALPLYDSAIKLAPDRFEFYSNRGYTRYRLHDTIGALNDYYKAIELDSTDVATYMYLESVLSDMGDYDTGVKYACKAIELGHIPAYFIAGQDLYILGEYEASVDAFLNYLERSNDSQRLAFYGLGYSYLRLGQLDNAQSCWDKANELAGYDMVKELNNKPGNKYIEQ